MEVKKYTLGQLGTNGYLLMNDEDLVIIDPAGEPNRLIKEIESINIKPKAILLTHAHFDHIGALDALRDEYGVPVYLHANEHEWLENPALNGSKYFPVKEVICQPTDHTLNAGPMSIGDMHFTIIETPGHSPGGVAFVFNEERLIISGDSLFHRGIGRTDLPLGDYDTLIHTIKEQLFHLPDDYVVYPGHGPATTIGDEKKLNPFV
ncbi:hydroxyacylglutathione hydrolase [Halolactibacillus miurensis]|uniref:Glyoxylase, beta-lactamase superfamily II n=1 Tax=Halolactibacillus miurensis TaxID=306541 RepID=A0A1I6PRF3_9BACI|nr:MULTISPECIES: MBL fold metallo-hydrolase [Halolactibacillus]GEM04405.1 hydroxyacylglutathione hydrolase [Halolactibacillus miurensis]SFS42787.1 Glyoxylase, beta-lactamase superfamily II [Halolactibacillus miurensis]